MAILGHGRTDGAPATLPITGIKSGLAIALTAATFGYLLHHLPFFEDHAMLTSAAALAVAGVMAAAFVFLLAPPQRQVVPIVVLDRDRVPVRRLDASDLDFCIALHRETLGHGFFVQLGNRFMLAYYRSFLQSPHAVALKAEVGAQPVGFLVGALRARAHRRWMIRHRGIVLAALGAAGLASRPATAARFARTRLSRYTAAWRRHRAGTGPAPSGPASDPAVLTHVAIVSGARGTGAGRGLVHAMVTEGRRAGAERILLTTLAGAAGAGPFYAALGWTRSALHRTPDGSEVEEWSLDLGAPEAER